MSALPRAAPVPTQRSISYADPLRPDLGYVLLPRGLLADLRDSPVAIAVYALVGRLYRIYQQPVPLSVNDLLLYDPCLRYGAASRAFDRLIRDGWLIATHTGTKTAYTPTWGLIGAKARPWDLQTACLGCPRHTATLRLDQRLFDTCIGRMEPHRLHPALVDRYVTSPLLSLRDVGHYALCLAGMPHKSAKLASLGLVQDAQARPFPNDQTLLALASQQPLRDNATNRSLTDKGYARLGMHVTDTVPATPEATPLFFVPPELIGGVIGATTGPLIGSSNNNIGHFTPLESAKAPLANTAEGSHGVMESMHNHGSPPTTHNKIQESSSGSKPNNAPSTGNHRAPNKQGGDNATTLPATESTHLLMSINVLPQIIRELADCPAAEVQAAIDDAHSRPHVRDVPAWVVAILRTRRDHDWWEIGRRPFAESPSWREYAALLEHNDGASSSILSPSDSSVSVQSEQLATPGDGTDPIDKGAALLESLRVRLPRRLWALIDQLDVAVGAEGCATLICRDHTSYATVVDQIHPLLIPIARSLGLEHVSVRMQVAGSAPPREAEIDLICPVWIDQDRWEHLPRAVQAALYGSTLASDGTIQDISNGAWRMLQRCYGELLALLIEDARTLVL
jgi:hypothetical protein